jgi:predicted nuclease of predicted toxin-antitoxin system
LDQADDLVIWDRAKRDGFCIVSKDDDFLQRSSLEGAPPKVIWLRVGNCPTARIEALLRSRLSEITEFGNDPDLAFLVLS